MYLVCVNVSSHCGGDLIRITCTCVAAAVQSLKRRRCRDKSPRKRRSHKPRTFHPPTASATGKSLTRSCLQPVLSRDWHADSIYADATPDLYVSLVGREDAAGPGSEWTKKLVSVFLDHPEWNLLRVLVETDRRLRDFNKRDVNCSELLIPVEGRHGVVMMVMVSDSRQHRRLPRLCTAALLSAPAQFTNSPTHAFISTHPAMHPPPSSHPSIVPPRGVCAPPPDTCVRFRLVSPHPVGREWWCRR